MHYLGHFSHGNAQHLKNTIKNAGFNRKNVEVYVLPGAMTSFAVFGALLDFPEKSIKEINVGNGLKGVASYNGQVFIAPEKLDGWKESGIVY